MKVKSKKVRNQKTENAYLIFLSLLRYESKKLTDKEHLWIMPIDDVGHITCVYIAAVGLERICALDAFDLFKTAFNYDVKKLIIAHNQVCDGRPHATNIDIDYTNKIYHQARILGIEVYDHIIFKKENIMNPRSYYYSYIEHGLMEVIAKDVTYKSFIEVKQIFEKKKEIAKTMLKNDEDILKVMKYMGETKEEIEKLKTKECNKNKDNLVKKSIPKK